MPFSCLFFFQKGKKGEISEKKDIALFLMQMRPWEFKTVSMKDASVEASSF